MSSTTKYTDMGLPEEETLWKYTSLTEPLLTSELARLSSATSIGDTDAVTFQPCPNPDSLNQDRFVIQDWNLPDGLWSFRAIFDGASSPFFEPLSYLALSQVMLAMLPSTM